MNWLRSKLGLGGKTAPRRAPSIPPGEVVYAIGDIHGRADLLHDLLRQIEADIALTPELNVRVITLGDYVDRGADSKGVIDILDGLVSKGSDRMIVLKCNHEEALLDFLDDPTTGVTWAEYGGRATLVSYGVTPPRGRGDPESWAEARDAFAQALPDRHLAFLRSLQLSATVGDYVFVHAGLRPGIPLDQQDERDLLWIRQEFLDAPAWSEDGVVVHGHSAEAAPSEGPGRIGVDTGAYATGVLTALRLEGDRRRYLRTGV